MVARILKKRRTHTLERNTAMISRTISSLAFTALTLSACASTPGAQPTDMSAAQHQQAAASHEGEAAPHAAAYDPSAKQVESKCGGRGLKDGACWTSTSNPTAEHKMDAEKHRKMAADHRAAGESLRKAEAQSCSGIAESDRDMSPFDHREDISSVAPATAMLPEHGKVQNSKVTGATVTFRALPGMTQEWLQRVVDCHIARSNSMGGDMPEMAYCPLMVKGASATVNSTGNGFAVTVQSTDPASAQEIVRRAQALKSGA